MGTIIKIVIAIILAVILLRALELAALAGLINAIGEGLKNSLTQKPTPVINPTTYKEKEVISNKKNNLQIAIKEQQYLNENPDIMDMPPWEHENKWNRIYNNEQICWYHKKSMKKFCKSKNEKYNINVEEKQQDITDNQSNIIEKVWINPVQQVTNGVIQQMGKEFQENSRRVQEKAMANLKKAQDEYKQKTIQ